MAAAQNETKTSTSSLQGLLWPRDLKHVGSVPLSVCCFPDDAIAIRPVDLGLVSDLADEVTMLRSIKSTNSSQSCFCCRLKMK